MEDYVDDILEKLVTREEHLDVLAVVFDRLEKYKVRLNPKKCVFVVTSWKLLGYVVSQWGIEVDPIKFREILEMPPKNISQLRSLQGKLQPICRFIAQLADKCHPFQHFLHKNIKFKWDDKCQQDFQFLKEYLLNPSIIMPPIQGKPWLHYILAILTTLGALLAQQDHEGKEQAIY